MDYKNILLAYDDSKYSEAALIEMIHFAKEHGSKLTMVHSVFFDSEEFGISPGQIEKRIAKGKEACEKARSTYCDEFDINIEYIVAQGEPHEVIPEIARKRKADLIAMGTYGRRGLKRLFMGSVTAGVIVDAPCDVLVVKRKCEDCTGSYHRIVVPYDGSGPSAKAITRVHEISSNGNTSVTIMYVIPGYEGMEFLRTSSIRKSIEEEASKIVLQGENLAHDNGITANTVIEEGRASDKIVETAEGLGSDLIILGSHGWHGLDKTIMGSTTERVIARSPVPVLVVK